MLWITLQKYSLYRCVQSCEQHHRFSIVYPKIQFLPRCYRLPKGALLSLLYLYWWEGEEGKEDKKIKVYSCQMFFSFSFLKPDGRVFFFFFYTNHKFLRHRFKLGMERWKSHVIKDTDRGK